VSNHRAARRGGHRPAGPRPSVPTSAHRAEPRPRRSFVHAFQALRGLPAIPTIIGIAALGVAGAGAVTIGDEPASANPFALSAHGGSLQSGTDAIGFAGTSSRDRAISRDSERQAMQDAADDRLEQAAEEQAAERNAALKSLGRAAEARAGEIAKNQWKIPTSGYHLTARFGMAGGLWSSNHTGLDFAAPTGTPIMAVANGVITKTGSAGAYGNQTIETLDDGTEIWYCHQSEIGVKVGQVVTGGQQIGRVGATGNTTGPHLHLEVRPGGGDPVDPETALTYHGVKP
jgi:murein DD-endopeptidase MepM/ murein hydrolase activator NlpD